VLYGYYILLERLGICLLLCTSVMGSLGWVLLGCHKLCVLTVQHGSSLNHCVL